MSGLHEAFAEIVADVPVYGDVDRAIEQADRERRHRYGVVAGLAAAAAVVVVIVGVLAVTRDGSGRLQPIGPSPTPTPTETTAPANPVVNGRIQTADEYLAGVGATCDGCYPAAFDRDSSTLLAGVVANGHPAALRVFGPDGRLAALDCPDAACGDGFRELDLGPNTDEVSVLNVDAAAEVYVVGFDGTVRRTIDLSAVGDDFYDFQRLAWSPDGRRLALTTFDAKIWVVDSEGGKPQLVYSPDSATGPAGKYQETVIWGTTWSPDGRRLGFIEGHVPEADSGTPTLFQAISVLLPGPGQDALGEASTLYDHSAVVVSSRSGGMSDFLWSPDGARVAVTVDDHVLELSADDGSVLARHPFVESSYLVWPARQP